MQVASGGRACGPDLGDEFPHPDRLALLHADAFEVIVGGDQAVAVVDLHSVAAAPGMPSHCPHHAGVRCIDVGPTGGRKILAPVELTCRAADGTCPQAKV